MVHGLLNRTKIELTTLAMSGLDSPGPNLYPLTVLADELADTHLGRLAERLRTVVEEQNERNRADAWATAWAATRMVSTQLLKPAAPVLEGVVVLPHAANILMRRPRGDLDSVDGLLSLLSQPDFMVRAYAAGCLAEIGDGAVTGLLAAQQQCGRCIRFLCIETLARIGTIRALKGLVGLLGDRDVNRPLETALLAHGEKSAPLVNEALVQVEGRAKAKNMAERRRAAAKILWQLGYADGLKPLVEDNDPLVAAYAQAALWTVDRLWRRDEQKSAADLPAALMLYRHGRIAHSDLVMKLDTLPKNRLSDGADVLRNTDAEPLVLDHYLEQLTSGQRLKDRERAAVLVTHLASAQSLAPLLALLDASNFQVLPALAELADSTATLPLMRMAEQKGDSPAIFQPSSQMPAPGLVHALGRIGDPAAVALLLRSLNSGAGHGRRAAVEDALAATGGPAVAAIAETLNHLQSDPLSMAPVLERALKRIKTPEAKAALKIYRRETDELTRFVSRLADEKEGKREVEQVTRIGVTAFAPLLAMVSEAGPIGKENAVLALVKLAPDLSSEERGRLVSAVTGQLRANHAQAVSLHLFGVTNRWIPLLVSALCELSAEEAMADLRAALPLNGAGTVLAKRWQETRSSWYLEVFAQGIKAPDTRVAALQAASTIMHEAEAGQTLRPVVTAVIQSETDAIILFIAIRCLQQSADGAPISLLRDLQNRWSTLAGSGWHREALRNEVDAALAEAEKKRTWLDRLRGQ